jgi:hypothetical protein
VPSKSNGGGYITWQVVAVVVGGIVTVAVGTLVTVIVYLWNLSEIEQDELVKTVDALGVVVDAVDRRQTSVESKQAQDQVTFLAGIDKVSAQLIPLQKAIEIWAQAKREEELYKKWNVEQEAEDAKKRGAVQ